MCWALWKCLLDGQLSNWSEAMAMVLESSRCSCSRLPRPSEITVGLTAPIPIKTSACLFLFLRLGNQLSSLLQSCPGRLMHNPFPSYERPSSGPKATEIQQGLPGSRSEQGSELKHQINLFYILVLPPTSWVTVHRSSDLSGIHFLI